MIKFDAHYSSTIRIEICQAIEKQTSTSDTKWFRFRIFYGTIGFQIGDGMKSYSGHLLTAEDPSKKSCYAQNGKYQLDSDFQVERGFRKGNNYIQG